KTEEWEKDGVKRYTTRIRVNTMNMLDKASGGSGNSTPSSYTPPAAAKSLEEQNEKVIDSIVSEGDDDLPF
ncbi:MAG: single-stranded DNA-binding protein, partial [Bacteroidia bacterium]